MTEQEKDKWVAELRSGKFEQGKEALLTQDWKYCCLGVKLATTGYQGQLYEDTYDTHTALNTSKDATKYFAWLNDLVGLSFEEIALVIENVPEVEWFRVCDRDSSWK